MTLSAYLAWSRAHPFQILSDKRCCCFKLQKPVVTRPPTMTSLMIDDHLQNHPDVLCHSYQ